MTLSNSVVALLALAAGCFAAEVPRNWVANVYAQAWESDSYDLADIVGYERVGPKEVPFGKYKRWTIDDPPGAEGIKPHPELAGPGGYSFRLGGIHRGEWYTADQFGKLLSEHGVLYGSYKDGDADEMTRLGKKYGLESEVGVPSGFKEWNVTGLGPADMARYRAVMRDGMLRSKREIEQREKTYGISILRNPKTQWQFKASQATRSMLEAISKNYDAFNASFKSEFGFDLPLTLDPSTPRDKARRSLLIQWVRTRVYDLMRMRMEAFREVLQPAGYVVSNLHGEDVIDYETHGAIVDFPGPGVRAQLSEHELLLRYWDGYMFRLWRDLTHKPLYASPRINNAVIRARNVPDARAVKYWNNQAVQNGAVGFYLWLLDYGNRKPPSRDEMRSTPAQTNGFEGPCFGNPDPSTLGKERWETTLSIAKKLFYTRTFDPPKAKTGILVSFDTVNVDGWKRVFSLYVELRKAGVWAGFLSDREILNGHAKLADWSVIYVPVLDYTHEQVASALRDYANSGGMLIACDPRVLTYNMSGDDISHLRQELFGVQLAAPRKGSQRIRLGAPYSAPEVVAAGGAWTIRLAGAEAIGKYADGGAAVTVRKHGKGKAVFWAGPIADIYITAPGDRPLDGRASFYKTVEKERGIEDLSWIWRITVDNLDRVTGPAKGGF